MLRRISHILLIIAFMGATGSHWAVLQTVAWTNMFVDNATEEPLSSALIKTFDGHHPCALCKQIDQGRQSEKKADSQPETKKPEFLNQKSNLVISPPNHFFLTEVTLPSAKAMTDNPPVPPPRFLFV